MNTIPLNVSDESNALLEPNLHDGRLVGINLPSQGIVELTVADVGGKKYRILLEDVLHVHATDFLEGNIILDVTVGRGDKVQIADLESLEYLWRDAHGAKEYLHQLHRRVVQESLFVLELNPSYGCHLIGVSRNVQIQPV